MKVVILLLFILLVAPVVTNGQEVCATMEYLQRQIGEDPSIELKMKQFEADLQEFLKEADNLKATNGVVTIPVVFHIIYKEPTENLSDLRIAEQMQALNANYRGLCPNGSMGAFPLSLKSDCEIQFCLAAVDPWGNPTNGIERRETSVPEFAANNNMKRLATGGLDAWNPDRYFNVWVCNMEGLLNYGQFPGTGVNSTYGAVDDYMCVGFTGATSYYNLGSIPTHELGHCFNLHHIWGDDGTACTGTDYCNDTPNQAGYVQIPAGSMVTDACSPVSPGIMYMNFMDYTVDMYSTNFTPDQKLRMQALFNPRKGVLYNLSRSTAGVPPALSCNPPLNLSEIETGENHAILSWECVAGANAYNVQYMADGGSTWTTINLSACQKLVEGLQSFTTYIWRAQTVCAGGTSTWSPIVSFKTMGTCPSMFAFEPNETMTGAALVQTGQVTAAGIPLATDQDWYKFTTNGVKKKLRVEMYNLPGDYDMVLYNSAGTILGESHNTGLVAEKIIYNASKTGTYYLHVYATEGAANAIACYTMLASVSATNYSSFNPEDVAGQTPPDDQFSLYPNPARGSMKVDYDAAEEGLLTVRIFNILGMEVDRSIYPVQPGPNQYVLDIAEMKAGIYLVNLNSGSVQRTFKVVVQ